MGAESGYCDSQLLGEPDSEKTEKMNAINYVFILIAGAAVASAGFYCKTGFDTPACLLIEAAKLPSGPAAAPPVPVDCTLCYARAVALRITDETVYKPKCVGRRFAHQQFDQYKNQVFCVESDGHEIPGSRQKGKTGNCKKFPRKGAKPKPRAAPAAPLCIRKRGQATAAKSAFIPVCNGPNFAGHRAFKFSCKGKVGTTQPHPTDCSRYIQCTKAGTFGCACTSGMKFDKTEGVCNFSKKVKC